MCIPFWAPYIYIIQANNFSLLRTNLLITDTYECELTLLRSDILFTQVHHTASTCVHCYRDIWIPPTSASIRPLTWLLVQTIRMMGGSDVACSPQPSTYSWSCTVHVYSWLHCHRTVWLALCILTYYLVKWPRWIEVPQHSDHNTIEHSNTERSANITQWCPKM
jgi:hypothetical protein